MLEYFIIFVTVGFILGKVTYKENIAITIIIFISVFWGITYAPIWGFASLGEMSLGYIISKKLTI